MRLSRSLLSALRSLLAGESVAASSLRHDVAERLLSEGVLTVSASGSRRKYSAIDTGALRGCLASLYEELGDIEALDEICQQESATRAAQAAATGNSKLVAVKACPGFPVNSFQPIPCRISGKEIEINPPEGTFLFISDWRSFAVPEDVLVMGVENMENFRCVRQQAAWLASLFPGERILFVSRYPQSTDLRSWLKSIANRYVHFGDFDLAGINIFLTEFRAHLGSRATFFIPPDIEQRLAAGSRDRYNRQYGEFKGLASDSAPIQQLIDLINRYHRCYDQEGYIARGF